MLEWPHSGFHVHHAVRLKAADACGILQLARYPLRRTGSPGSSPTSPTRTTSMRATTPRPTPPRRPRNRSPLDLRRLLGAPPSPMAKRRRPLRHRYLRQLPVRRRFDPMAPDPGTTTALGRAPPAHLRSRPAHLSPLRRHHGCARSSRCACTPSTARPPPPASPLAAPWTAGGDAWIARVKPRYFEMGRRAAARLGCRRPRAARSRSWTHGSTWTARSHGFPGRSRRTGALRGPGTELRALPHARTHLLHGGGARRLPEAARNRAQRKKKSVLKLHAPAGHAGACNSLSSREIRPCGSSRTWFWH